MLGLLFLLLGDLVPIMKCLHQLTVEIIKQETNSGWGLRLTVDREGVGCTYCMAWDRVYTQPTGLKQIQQEVYKTIT